MPKVSDFQASFNAGELSPRMQGRGDFQKFKSGAAVVENMLALPQGGLTRRPGTRYVVGVKDQAAKTRLLDFVFSTSQAYIIEAGNLYFRFCRNQGQIVAADITGSIANGTFATDLASWTDLDGGAGASTQASGTMNLNPGGTASTDFARREQSVAVTNGGVYTLSFRILGGKAGDKVRLRVGTASEGTQTINDEVFTQGYHVRTFTAGAATIYIGFSAYGSDQNKSIQVDDVAFQDNVAIELVTPYVTADLFTLKWAQTADTMYIVHPSYATYKLTRSGHTSWSLSEVRWEDGPYFDMNTTGTTMTPAAGTGNAIVFTASTQTGVNKNSGFSTSDVGRSIRFRNASTEWLWGIIVGSTSAVTCQVDILRTSTSTGASTQWRLGTWGSTDGYPAAISFFEQRLYLARNTTLPQSFWASQAGEIENQRPDSLSTGVVVVETDDALDFTIASDQDAIRWMSAGVALVLGTDGGEWIVDSDGALITPTDINVRKHTKQGTADVAPVRVDHAVLFTQKAGRRIHEFAFRFEVDGFVAPDMTLLSDHVLKTTVVEMAYQAQPDSILWALRDDGQIATMTYRRDQDIVGWGRQKLGGTYQDGDTVVESVRTIPGQDGSGQTENSEERDEVWVIAKRTIGGSTGSTARYIEFLEKSFEGPREDDYSSTTNFMNAMLKEQRFCYYADSLLTRNASFNISAISQDSTALVTTSTNHGYSTGSTVVIHDVVGMKGINNTASTAHPAYIIGESTSVTTFRVLSLGSTPISSTAFSPWISGGKVRSKVTTVGGSSHLAGESVAILADGAVHSQKTVTSTGDVTLDYGAAVVQVGLPYTHTFKSMRLAPNTPFGPGFGKTGKVGQIALLLLDSGSFNIGPKMDALSAVDFRQIGDPTNFATPLTSTEYLYDFAGRYTTDPRIVIQSSNPQPFTLLGMVPDVMVGN